VSHEAHGDYRPAARRAATAALAGDTAAGEKIFKAQCGICHAVAAGENRIGPTLFGVVGRPAQRNDAMCQNPKSAPTRAPCVFRAARRIHQVPSPASMMVNSFSPGPESRKMPRDIFRRLEAALRSLKGVEF
jgi:cytochrome c551/c552